MISGAWPVLSAGDLASLQSTGAQRIGSQDQVHHQNAGALALFQLFGCDTR